MTELPEPEIVVEGQEDEAPGLFPSWGWLYGSLIAYGVLTILVLRYLTVTMNVQVMP